MKPEVWAPYAQRVDLVVFGPGSESYARDLRRLTAALPAAISVHPMYPAAQGWWTTQIDLPDGRDYAFLLDGARTLPDPRSARQPYGIHGASRVVATTPNKGFRRGTALIGGVGYELHIGTFTSEGTFDAAIDKLHHLVELGVDFVEILPVSPFPGRHGWGYDGVFPYAVHEPYGGPEGLRRFVEACHGRGLAVVLDVVYNHLGPDGNILADYGPYFTDRYTTPWGKALNFDGPDSDHVRRYVVDNALRWFEEFGIDGLRLDAVHAIVDISATHILEELAAETTAATGRLDRPLILIAESDLNDPRLITSRRSGGYGLTAQWSDDFHHALHVTLTGERDGYYADFIPLTDLATSLARGFVYTGQYSRFRRRRHGRSLPSEITGHQLVGYAQNHDQIGNRARGERLCHLLSFERSCIAAALVLTSPFTPLLFMGEEWAAGTPWQYFTDHDDPELARAVSEGRRKEFAAFEWNDGEIPDPQDPATYRRSILDWTELKRSPHTQMLDWYRHLIALRRRYDDLSSPRFPRVDVDEDAGILVIHRGCCVVAVNLSAKSQTIPLEVAEVLASSQPCTFDETRLVLPPDSVVIARRHSDGSHPSSEIPVTLRPQ
ncbi:MAG: malto-oligosyltrehalose trehalohydrolase [Acidothermus sp.]|nr:malto-oligosyltrehalose trehalohydrolase [Acidothermus sp.]MCL6537120.1 malto-oligosyltrehalose trehalohydrolase [Acidothermus sp.]